MNYKKLIKIFFIFTMCFCTYATAVEDNSGSAFITKAEFDALKSSFQSQIDTYNRNIDSKIDEAISMYLSGMTVIKKTELYPRVSNYKDVTWMNNLYTKIKKRTFTAKNTYSDKEEYATPLYEKRRNIRCGRTNIGWGIPFDVNVEWFRLSLSNDSTTIDIGGEWFNEYDGKYTTGPCPVNFIKLIKQSDGEYTYNSGSFNLCAEQCCGDRSWGTVHSAQEGTSGHLNNCGGYACFTNNTSATYFKVLTPAAGQYLRYQFNLAGINGTNSFGGTSYLNSKNLQMTPVQSKNFNTSGVPFTITSCGSFVTRNTNGRVLETRDIDQGNDDDNVIKDLMLGADCTNLVNVVYESSDYYIGSSPDYSWDWSKSDSGEASFKYANVAVGSTSWNRTSTVGFPTNYSGSRDLTTPFKIKMPFFPQMKLSELVTDHFKLDGKRLKIGQGLPFAKIIYDGFLTLKLDYTVYDADRANSGTTPSQEIKLSIKKDDFTFTTGYCKDESGNEIKDKVYNSNKIELKIPVKNADELWLRLGPNTTSASGLYAKITNIEMILNDK